VKTICHCIVVDEECMALCEGPSANWHPDGRDPCRLTGGGCLQLHSRTSAVEED